MAKHKEKLVHCRYPKCMKLHESTELKKNDAVQGGKRSWYHPDCYHTMQTVNKIRDTFLKEVDPMMTGKQIGQLVSIVNNMVFAKKIDVDYILFSLNYFINNKPGALKYPGGIAYIVQDKDVSSAWGKEKQRKVREEIKEKQKSILVTDEFKDIDVMDLPDTAFIKANNSNNRSKFSSILGV